MAPKRFTCAMHFYTKIKHKTTTLPKKSMEKLWCGEFGKSKLSETESLTTDAKRAKLVVMTVNRVTHYPDLESGFEV